MKVYLKKTSLKGEIDAIGSKSYAHRELIAASLSHDSSLIDNVPSSKDIQATMQCLSSLGASFVRMGLKVEVTPIREANEKSVLDCIESGSTYRFLIPVALALTDSVTFVGSPRLFQRGIGEYEKIFAEQGISYHQGESSLTVEGRLKPGHFIVDGSLSSQFITGLLFALPLLKEDSVIEILPPINSRNYIDITIAILKRHGVEAVWKDNSIQVKGNQNYLAKDGVVEGDYSNAAFLDAFNYFGGEVTIHNLNDSSLQGDKVYQSYFRLLNEGYQVIDVSNCIDLSPVLFTFAAMKHGAKFINTARLAVKESNRAIAMKEELSKVGIKMEVYDNEVIIPKQDLSFDGIPCFSSHHDHRIVMALSLLCCHGDIMMDGIEAVSKSYPDYFKDLEKLGAEVSYE